MPTPKQWADFLAKIGLKITKKHIAEYISTHFNNGNEVWDYYIESNDLVKETVLSNRINSPGDIDAYFSEIDYAQMRGTYPRRSRGRSFIVPRLLTIQDVKARKEQALQRELAIENAKKVKALESLIGRRIRHKLFGFGTIKEVFSGKYIVVAFDNEGIKQLDYELCKANHIISVE